MLKYSEIISIYFVELRNLYLCVPCELRSETQPSSVLFCRIATFSLDDQIDIPSSKINIFTSGQKCHSKHI